jgi:hypothetical protein
MRTVGNGHSRAATSARRRGRRANARPGEEPIAALTPDLGPLPPIPVALGAVLATDPTLVIARMVARAWMRYRTDGHRMPRAPVDGALIACRRRHPITRPSTSE